MADGARVAIDTDAIDRLIEAQGTPDVCLGVVPDINSEEQTDISPTPNEPVQPTDPTRKMLSSFGLPLGEVSAAAPGMLKPGLVTWLTSPDVGRVVVQDYRTKRQRGVEVKFNDGGARFTLLVATRGIARNSDNGRRGSGGELYRLTGIIRSDEDD